MVPKEFRRSTINTNEDGRKFWIFVDVPKEYLGREVTEEELNRFEPEICYLDRPKDWSRAAVEKLDYWLSLPDGGPLIESDRYILEKVLSNR